MIVADMSSELHSLLTQMPFAPKQTPRENTKLLSGCTVKTPMRMSAFTLHSTRFASIPRGSEECSKGLTTWNDLCYCLP